VDGDLWLAIAEEIVNRTLQAESFDGVVGGNGEGNTGYLG
jgi:hypothetical protein